MRPVSPGQPVLIGLICLAFLAGAVPMGTEICQAKESEKKSSSTPDPGLGKLSRQINDPEAYMRELADRLNSSDGQQLLTRGMPRQGWRPSSSPAPTTAPVADDSLPPLGSRSTPETPSGSGATQGLSPAPTQTRFGWSPGSGPAATAADEMARLRAQTGASQPTWMSPSERARQLDPLGASGGWQSPESTQPAPRETPAPPQSAPPANDWTLSPSPDGTRTLGQGTSAPSVDSRTWMAPEERTRQTNLDGARLLGSQSPTSRMEPWQYATPPQPQQTPQQPMTQTAPNGAATPWQDPYAAQAPAQQWQTQQQMTQTARNGAATPWQDPYAAQAPPQPWQTPPPQMTQTAPNGTPTPWQDSHAAQATPQWPTATAPSVPWPDTQAAHGAMGELETIYPGERQPQPEPAPAAPAIPARGGWGSQAGMPMAQDPRIPAADSPTETTPRRSQADLTQTWLSPRNRAAQAALQEMAAPSQPQEARATASAPVRPTPPVAASKPAPKPVAKPTPSRQAARTAVNGSQARHFYEEQEPAWSLGADLDKYRAHAVSEGSRDSGESLMRALGSVGLAIEDTTNIITLGYASDRAKPFRANDGKGFLDDPGRVPQQAGATIASLGHGLYSVADLVTFNSLPNSQKAAYLDNHPLVRPFVFTGQTIGGAWRTTEEIGNALTWGYFDNVTGSIGMCIESIIEVLKHTGQAVTNLARAPVRLIAGNNEEADKALDWVLLVPLEMASNMVQMKGIANMDDYETAFAEKGVIGSVIEFGGSTFLAYRAIDRMLDELDNNKKSKSRGGSSPGTTTPEFPAPIADLPTGGGISFWWEGGWPTM